MRDQLKWYDDKVANSPWIDALAELRQGHCFQHVQAITVAIDQYGEKALGKVPLPGLPWSPAFMEVYEAALANSGAVVVGASRTMAGTLNAAVVAYYQSAAFKCELGEGSKAGQRSLVEQRYLDLAAAGTEPLLQIIAAEREGIGPQFFSAVELVELRIH